MKFPVSVEISEILSEKKIPLVKPGWREYKKSSTTKALIVTPSDP
jgi:hypothetical protein